MKILHVVFILGAVIAGFFVTEPYPILGSGPILLCVAILAVLAAAIITTASKVGFRAGPSYILIALLPWFLAGSLIANGALDHSPEVDYQTVLMHQDYGRSYLYLTVRSWRPGRATESLYVKTGFNLRTGKYWPDSYFYEGDAITIGVRSGAFSMPWICRISQRYLSIEYPSWKDGKE